jgi:hypothetical protein
MATIKFTDSTIPSKFTLAKKQYEVTCGYQVTNSDFLNLLLDGYQVTTGIPSEVTTGLPSNHTEVTTSIPQGIPSEVIAQLQAQIGDFSRTEYDSDMKQIRDTISALSKNMYNTIKKNVSANVSNVSTDDLEE